MARLARQLGAYTEFNVALPLAALGGGAELLVVADNRFDFVPGGRTPTQGPLYDFYQYGGLFRDVTLHFVPAFDSLQALLIDAGDAAERTIGVRFRTMSGTCPTYVYVDGVQRFVDDAAGGVSLL